MRGKHIKIELSETARTELEAFIKSGKRSVRLVNRAKIILALDEACERKSFTQEQIAQNVSVSQITINNTKKAFLETDSVSVFLQKTSFETNKNMI